MQTVAWLLSIGNVQPIETNLKTNHILAISGSLRATSLNTAMLRMARTCAPPGVHVHLYYGLGNLPLFNPDIESDEPRAVMQLQTAICQADAVLFDSPEYAHGISGVLKNALDWMVSSGVLVGKPAALWNASPRASHALAALREILKVMSVRLVEDADLQILMKAPESGLPYNNPDPAAMLGSLQCFAANLAAHASGREP